MSEKSIVDKCIESKWKYLTKDAWVDVLINLAKSLEQENKELKKKLPVVKTDSANLDACF